MAEHDLGPGERAGRARRRFMLMLIIGGGALGGILGGVIGGSSAGKGGFDPAHLTLNPAAAVLMAAGCLIALVALPLYMFVKVDEMKAKRNMKAMTAGCLAVIGGYPAWQMLAAGGFVPQPSALGMFVIAYGIMALVSLFLRFRG
ncbi:hypothetical protein [Sphingomonas sp.]|jgi:hypothetical protein|uniref:hypothetical protein n=1 Tax=Sphingomonas sp. TaxID=28214 RepID=UPI002E340EC2|nr:hypothetical protein [Sphingomonas sp.]HEX4692996.1 hypothetical protein [Sphingomonas sp.]